MTPAQEAKLRARRETHLVHAVSAYLYPQGGGAATPCSVREHHNFQQVGDLQGTNLSYAERHEDTPRLIFDNTEIVPVRGQVVATSNGYVFALQTVHPPDGEFTKVDVARLFSAADIALYPTPSE